MIHNLIHIAIHKINPNATFTVIDNDTDKITWHDNTTPISKSDIEAKLAEVQAEYPSVEECVHALLDGGDTLTKLQEDRQAVKTKYPKGA